MGIEQKPSLANIDAPDLTGLPGPKLSKLGIKIMERSILEGWGLKRPYQGYVACNQDGEKVYYWHGVADGTLEVPVLAVTPSDRVLSENLNWCFGVVNINNQPIITPEICVTAAEYPAFSDGSILTLLGVAITQLNCWVGPYAAEVASHR